MSGHAAARRWNQNHDGPDLDACPKKEVPLPSVATERGGSRIYGYLGCNARYVVQVARWHTHEVVVYTGRTRLARRQHTERAWALTELVVIITIKTREVTRIESGLTHSVSITMPRFATFLEQGVEMLAPACAKRGT